MRPGSPVPISRAHGSPCSPAGSKPWQRPRAPPWRPESRIRRHQCRHAQERGWRPELVAGATYSPAADPVVAGVVYAATATGLHKTAQNGLLIYGNQWLREFCGIALSDLPRDPLSVVVPEDRDLVREQMVKRMRGEESLPQYTVRLPRKDGSIAHVELISKVVTYRGLPAIQGSIVDISAKVAAEQRLREYAARLEESNQLKQLFNDILSHDLLAPLWAASGQVDLLAERVQPEHRDPMRSIQSMLGEAREILADAHAFLRLRDDEGLSFSRLDVCALLREVATFFAPEFERKEIALDLRLSPALRAEASPVLKQAFSNLLSNALKYCLEGSTVIVEAHDGSRVRVVFRNRGERIPPEFREQVFQRFVQGGKRGIKGVGLGLAIVRRIADLHRGRAWIEDDPEGGCAFFFEFPSQRPLPDGANGR